MPADERRHAIIASVRGISTMPDCVAVKCSSSCVNTGSRNIEPISIANIDDADQRRRRERRVLEQAQVDDRRGRGELADDERDQRDDRRRTPRSGSPSTRTSRSREPSSNTYCSAATPIAISTMPAMSRFLRATSARARFAARTSSGSWTLRDVIMMPMMPTGRLM